MKFLLAVTNLGWALVLGLVLISIPPEQHLECPPAPELSCSCPVCPACAPNTVNPALGQSLDKSLKAVQDCAVELETAASQIESDDEYEKKLKRQIDDAREELNECHNNYRGCLDSLTGLVR